MHHNEKEAWSRIVKPDDLDLHMANIDQAQANAGMVKEMFAKHPVKPAGKILIHGCGTAQMFDYIAPTDLGTHAQMTFADISPEMIEKARGRLGAAGLSGKTLVDDIES